MKRKNEKKERKENKEKSVISVLLLGWKENREKKENIIIINNLFTVNLINVEI